MEKKDYNKTIASEIQKKQLPKIKKKLMHQNQQIKKKNANALKIPVKLYRVS